MTTTDRRLPAGWALEEIRRVSGDLWHMGSLNDDGSVVCWSGYGDLHEALRGL
ncbi:hypothetical protein ACIREO_14760 [Streptomyces sp. NPDC102441]|uniref:hypothetical protein n=1 Tax=Streptomyces sp. NPDC102441 TaxID=3366176 RepID=UPI003800387F